jgi:hypothetical protein
MRSLRRSVSTAIARIPRGLAIARSRSSDLSIRVGVSVSRAEVCVIVVRRQVIAHAAVQALENPTDTSEALRRLFSSPALRAHAPQWLRASVGPSWSQVKRIKDLPQTGDRNLIRRMVSHGDARFFRRNGVPLAITNVIPLRPGEALVGAIDQHVIDVISTCCREAGLVLECVVPQVAALGKAIHQSVVRVSDGPVQAEIRYDDHGRLSDVRYAATVVGSAPELCECADLAEPLRALGSEGFRFAGAFGATTMAASDSLAFDPLREESPPPGAASSRPKLAVAALLIAVLGWYVAPLIAARRAATAAQAQYAARAVPYGKAARAADSLRVVSDELRSLAAFSSGRRSMTLYLAALTDALPESVQLVSLKVDSVGGTLTVLSAQSAAAVSNVAAIPMVGTASLGGAVTAQPNDVEQRQRATIVFRWNGRSLTGRRDKASRDPGR